MLIKNTDWLNIKEDYGLRLFAIMIIIYNGVLFLSSIFLFKMEPLAALPVLLSLSIISLCNKICKKGEYQLLIANIFLILTTVVINYIVVGNLDRSVGGLEKMDLFCIVIDNYLYSMPAAMFIERVSFTIFGSFQFIFYDFIMTVYFIYFLLPLVGMILVYKHYVKAGEAWKISRYAFSILASYMINMYLYLLIPVTGPQYYLRSSFEEKLPLSSYGQMLFDHIVRGQQTFIDCFPSGHLWFTLLATIWIFHINHKVKYIAMFITFCMIFATLGLRYHYTLDLLVAIPSAFILFWASFKLLKE